MFAPVRVQALQHDVALELVKDLGTDELDLGRVRGGSLVDDPPEDGFVAQARFILRPLDDRQL
jgi:hypothetical protein